MVRWSDVPKVFLSTPSARRATAYVHPPFRTSSISIHALREEGDRIQVPNAQAAMISIHALREEGDHYQSGHIP